MDRYTVKIIDRVGRINRVGTEYDRIYVFNFFPTAQSKKQMPLEERILEKLQAFYDTLGEDIKYLSDDEEVSSKKLFSLTLAVSMGFIWNRNRHMVVERIWKNRIIS